MTPIPSCPDHTDYPRQNCASCHALRSSLHTRALVQARRAAPTPAEQGDWDTLRDRYDNLDWLDQKAPTSVVDELDRLIVEWCRGDVT